MRKMGPVTIQIRTTPDSRGENQTRLWIVLIAEHITPPTVSAVADAITFCRPEMMNHQPRRRRQSGDRRRSLAGSAGRTTSDRPRIHVTNRKSQSLKSGRTPGRRQIPNRLSHPTGISRSNQGLARGIRVRPIRHLSDRRQVAAVCMVVGLMSRTISGSRSSRRYAVAHRWAFRQSCLPHEWMHSRQVATRQLRRKHRTRRRCGRLRPSVFQFCSGSRSSAQAHLPARHRPDS